MLDFNVFKQYDLSFCARLILDIAYANGLCLRKALTQKIKTQKGSKKMTKPIDDLMQKEVTRKEFLALVGLGLVTVAGFSTIVQFFTGKPHKTLQGYGSTPYGR